MLQKVVHPEAIFRGWNLRQSLLFSLRQACCACRNLGADLANMGSSRLEHLRRLNKTVVALYILNYPDSLHLKVALTPSYWAVSLWLRTGCNHHLLSIGLQIIWELSSVGLFALALGAVQALTAYHENLYSTKVLFFVQRHQFKTYQGIYLV